MAEQPASLGEYPGRFQLFGAGGLGGQSGDYLLHADFREDCAAGKGGCGDPCTTAGESIYLSRRSEDAVRICPV